MKKTNALWMILNSIFFIIFNALFFVALGVEHNASVWISYAFINFAYLMLLLTPKLIRAGKSSAVFGFSLYSISGVYFLVVFVTGLAFILIAPERYMGALLTQFCIAGIYGVALVSNMLANEQTANAEEKRQYQVEYVKDAAAKLKGFLDRINDKEAKKKIEKVYDAVYSSPVKSHPSLAQTESQILVSINELGNAISADNTDRINSLADSLLIAINERNRQLKISNQ